MPAIVEISLDQGSDFLSNVYTWTDSSGNPVDLTGATPVLKARTRPDGTSTVVLSLTGATAGASGITLGGTAGTVQFNVIAADAATVPAGQHYLTLQIGDIGGMGGAQTMLLTGILIVRGSQI